MQKHFLTGCLWMLAAMTCGAQQPQERREPLAGHVVLIGFDGWGAYTMDGAEMPTVREAMDTGAYTLEKRSVLPSSSAMNWASMLDGAPAEIHGYMRYNSRRPELPSRVVNDRGVFPTVFSLMAEQRPGDETGCLYDWGGIHYVIDAGAVSTERQGPDYGKHPEALTDMAVEYIREKRPVLLAVCYDNPDHVGHRKGHGSAELYAELTRLDARAARIVQAVRDAGFYDDTVFIFTSDHGGTGKGHGGYSLDEMQTPFVIAGRNVRPVGEFHESMMQYDVAATIVRILGLTPPQAWTGRPMEQVFAR